MADCSRTRDAVPLAVASMYQWRWHRSTVQLTVAALRGAEQKKAVKSVNVSTEGQQAEQGLGELK